MAKNQKFSPRTKHIALKHHHFRSDINNGQIEIVHVQSRKQIADIQTKPHEKSLFRYLRAKLCGW